MDKLSTGVLSCVIAGFSVSVNAGLLVDPIGKSEEGEMQVGVHYSAATTAYVVDCNDSGENEQGEKIDSDIVRNGITVYGAYGLNEKFDLYAGATYNMTTEIEKIDGEKFDVNGESGFEFGAGIRGELLELDNIKLIGYAQLEYIADDFGSNVYIDSGYEKTTKFTASGMEFSGGVLGLLEVSDQLSMYGGLELIPFGTMKIEYEESERFLDTVSGGIGSGQYKDSNDQVRDSMFGVRLGAKYMLNGEMFVRGEFAAVGEKSFTFGAGMNF